ncbi:MAG TPA: thioredoxin fold domain-containing protein, partial [Tepidisphaeraceae bacterium]|nr:thioredoxin fold domain-containing protein [Tepidisphaeraceae bacterium]
MARYLSEHLETVRVHVRDQKDEYKRLSERYNAQWTPTVLILDADGEERHRIEGFLPADDFLSQIALGLAKSAFQRKDYGEAERRYREIVDRFPSSEAAPEALYWAGVSNYKATGDPSALRATTTAFGQRYQDTAWAKKASV